jgi:hypothetical protein
MQDGTQEGNEAYVILHRGARSRGYKHRAREQRRERERETPLSTCLCHHVPLRPPSRDPSPRKALDIPFYRCKEMSSCTTGCSYALRGWRGSALSPVEAQLSGGMDPADVCLLS